MAVTDFDPKLGGYGYLAEQAGRSIEKPYQPPADNSIPFFTAPPPTSLSVTQLGNAGLLSELPPEEAARFLPQPSSSFLEMPRLSPYELNNGQSMLPAPPAAAVPMYTEHLPAAPVQQSVVPAGGLPKPAATPAKAPDAIYGNYTAAQLMRPVSAGGSSTTTTQRTSTVPDMPGVYSARMDIADLRQQGEAIGNAAREKLTTNSALVQGAYAKDIEAANAKMAKQHAAYVEKRTKIDAEAAKVRAEAAKEVDPDRWWASRRGDQKFALGIAAALQGALQGLQRQGGPNQVIAAIDGMIERDIKVQQLNIENARRKGAEYQSLLTDLRERLGDDNQAVLQDKIMKYEKAQTLLLQFAEQAKDPLQREQALNAQAAVREAQLNADRQMFIERQGRTVTSTTSNRSTTTLGNVLMAKKENELKLKLLQAKLDEANAPAGTKAKPELPEAVLGKLSAIEEGHGAADIVIQKTQGQGTGGNYIPEWLSLDAETRNRLVDDVEAKVSAALGEKEGKKWRTSVLSAGIDDADAVRQRVLDAEKLIINRQMALLKPYRGTRNADQQILDALKRQKTVDLLYKKKNPYVGGQ